MRARVLRRMGRESWELEALEADPHRRWGVGQIIVLPERYVRSRQLVLPW